jgi:hypothetical protein
MEKNKKTIDYIKNTDKQREDNKMSGDMMDSEKFSKTKANKL